MNRAGYSEDIDIWDLIRWRGQVASAIRGQRGQKFLRDLRDALLALPEKILIVHELQDAEGSVCAIGSLGVARGIDMSKIDPEDPDQVATAFNIAQQLAREIAYHNDEGGFYGENCEERFQRMLKWVDRQIIETVLAPGAD